MRKAGVPARRTEQGRLLPFARADFFHRGAESVGRTGKIRDQPRLLGHFHDHGAIARAHHLLEELRDGFAMALDEPGLAAADVGHQSDGERQVRFLPEIGDLARLAVVAKIEILALETPHGHAMIGDRATYRDQVDVDANVGAWLGVLLGVQQRNRNERHRQRRPHPLLVYSIRNLGK